MLDTNTFEWLALEVSRSDPILEVATEFRKAVIVHNNFSELLYQILTSLPLAEVWLAAGKIRRDLDGKKELHSKVTFGKLLSKPQFSHL